MASGGYAGTRKGRGIHPLPPWKPFRYRAIQGSDTDRAGSNYVVTIGKYGVQLRVKWKLW